MEKETILENNFSDLRKKAEKIINTDAKSILENQSPEEIQKLIHELNIYQIELEMQNDELRRSQLEIQQSQTEYSNLYDFAPVGYFKLNDKGIVLNANLTGASLLGIERAFLIGKAFNQFITKDMQDTFYLIFNELVKKKIPHTFELKLKKKDKTFFYAQLESKFVQGNDGNNSLILLSVTDITERKQLEEVLRESEKKYRIIAENMADIITTMDMNLRFTYVSPSIIRLRGFTVEEALEQTIDQIMTPDSFQLIANAFEEELRLEATTTADPDRTRTFELEEYKKDGSTIWVENTSSFIRDKDQKPIGILVVSRDITERKNAEFAIQENTETLKQAQRVAQIGSWWYDPITQMPTWTEEMFHVFGFEPQPQALPYEEHKKIIHPEDWDRFDAAVSQALTEGVGYDLELRIKRPNGEIRYVNSICKAKKNDDGVVTQLFGTTQDITERKRAEEETIKQKKMFETMFNTIPDGVVITNTKREIVLANKGMEKTFGYRPEDLLGRTTEILYANQDNYYETGTNVFDKNAHKPDDLYITYYRNIIGEVFPGETFGAKLFDEKNQWVGNLGIMRDITERVETEKRIQQLQKMESIGSLAGGIAHDFNNILFPIVGMSELLLEDLSPQSQEYENAQEILRAGKRGRDLVKQILAFSRQSEHKLIPIRAQQVLKEVIKLIRSTIPSYIEIDENIQSDCGLLMADPTQIHQVAMNIITNAFHAVESKGGKIYVELKEVFLGADELTAGPIREGRYALLSVTDTGHGISSDLMTKIFEPYFTTKEQGKGTGLGLAVVYGIVKEHKGDIKVYSEIGKGTTFNIYLPLMEKHVDLIEPSTAEPRYTGSENILLVDDEKSIAKLEKQMLERLGYKVTMRVNSLEALEAFKAKPNFFNLVISDMTMPSMTGHQLAIELKQIRANIPVIICTGFSERINEENAKSMGIDGLLMKPVVKSELAKAIRKLLDDAKDTAQGLLSYS